MKRRDFSLQLAGTGLGLALTGAARAQSAPVEGQSFTRLQTAVPLSLPNAQKKIEVIEFFSYACGHCFAFEPTLEAWAKQQQPDVHFHYMPVGFVSGGAWVPKVFFALEEMGQREALHRKIFAAIHVQRTRLNTEADITAFLVANGVDGGKFSDAYKSFSVNTKLSRAQQLASAYKVDSVPTLGVQGRYITSPALAGTSERTVPVLNYLVQRARQGG
jgi:thiol:disulfide interchange protein DsbA